MSWRFLAKQQLHFYPSRISQIVTHLNTHHEFAIERFNVGIMCRLAWLSQYVMHQIFFGISLYIKL